jgi:hypothetical protein
MMPLLRRPLLTNHQSPKNINNLFLCNNYNLGETLRRTSTMEDLKERQNRLSSAMTIAKDLLPTLRK